MRPGHYCPGKPALLATKQPSLFGFNEARALLPGKTRGRPVRRLRIGAGFNEARALLPGKTRYRPTPHFTAARLLQ